MNATPRSPSDENDTQPGASDADGAPPPTPDEDGPHDVPDDKVIEKTLPDGTGPERAGS